MKKVYFLSTFLFLLFSSAQAQTTWDNFEDSRKGTYGFISGSFIPYFENPDQTGANTSRVAASYTRNAAEAFDVIILDAAMADLSDYLSGTKQMSIDVWSPNIGTTVQITLENDVIAQPANFPTGRHSVYLATTTVANAWETLTFTFDNRPDATVANDNVNRIVLLFAPNTNTGDTYFWDNLNGPELASDPCAGVTPDPTILNDFECYQNTNFVFSHSGVNFRRVLNPDQNGNTSDYVATYTRNSGEEFDVIVGKFDGNLALQPNSSITLDVWDANAPTNIRLSLQADNGDVILAMDQMTAASSTWQTLTFDPSSVSASTDIRQFVILFDPGVFTGNQYYFDNFAVGTIVGVEDLEEINSFKAFPNPSNGITNFQYELQNAADVGLNIYDVTGKLVDQILNQTQPSGTHQAIWEAGETPNGIYFYTLSINGQIASGKIILNQ